LFLWRIYLLTFIKLVKIKMMKAFNKKSILVFTLLIIGLVLAVYLQQKANSYQKILSDKEALLVLNYGQGKQRWFKGEVINGMTVLGALKAASEAGNFNFSADGHLSALEDISNNGKKQWHCYINNKEITQGLDKTIINPKDKISCEYK